jgi:mevalonate kinase
VPVRYGQSLAVNSLPDGPPELHWRSLDEQGATWQAVRFKLPDLSIVSASDVAVAERLASVLLACRAANSTFLAEPQALEVTTRTDFPRSWGLGTSSTLVAAVARWAGVDPYPVLAATFGGSGYDLACAFADGPLLYSNAGRTEGLPFPGLPGDERACRVPFEPPFAEQLHFVFLGQKQDSRLGIQRYRALNQPKQTLLDRVSELALQTLEVADFQTFTQILLEHEQLVSAALDLPRAQDLHFADFPGVVKSLGAWGGDFVLAASPLDAAATRAYFAEKGHSVCIPYGEMAL